GGLARARTLEDVPHVRASVLGDTSKVRMTGAGLRDGSAAGTTGVGWRLDGGPHRVLPVHPVAVLDRHRNRTADGFAGSHTRQDLGAIRLDRHAAAAAVATLTTTQVGGDGFDVDRQ